MSFTDSDQIERMKYGQEYVGKRGNMHREAADMTVRECV